MQLTEKQKKERKLALGMPPSENFKHKCYAKSKKRANRANDEQLQAYAEEHPEDCPWAFNADGGVKHWYECLEHLDDIPGYVNHRKRKHKPCDVCRCTQVAGFGTIHLGSGYCMYHEKDLEPDEALAIADEHQKAILNNNPFEYEHASAYMEEVRRKAEESEQGIDLRDDISVLRGFIQEILAKADPEADPRIMKSLTRIANSLDVIREQNDLDELAPLLTKLNDIMDQITKRWAMGVTESTKDGPAPASDIAKMRAVSNLMNTASKMMGQQWKFDAKNYISQDTFNAWLYRVMTEIQSMSPNERWWNKLLMKLKQIDDPETAENE